LPERIGHYRVTGRIGRGAMGVVYSGRDERTGRAVALKVMMADLEGDAETRERFSREANVAGKMLHRNVINVYEMGEEDGRLYMVMELLEGETLGDYMKRVGQLPLEHALDLMMQVCEGLAIAHAHAIVHRDIKPGNLFVLRDGGLKILDFGVARLANSSMTASGFIVGTPDFMSPEQARGREIDQRSDVFSAGAVFYYMLSGTKPFTAPDLPAVLHKVNSVDPAPLAPEQCPPGLWRILMKALAKPSAARYADMGQLLADLVRFEQEFDNQTRAMAAAARDLAIEVTTLARERAAQSGRPVAPFSDALLDRYPVLEERGAEALGVVPFRRAALTAIREDLGRRRLELQAEPAPLRGQRAAT
jgi:serine/threonine-protein kinase